MATARITAERIDDMPLLLRWLLDMHIDQIIDAVLKSPHGNRQGLSYSQLAVVFVAYILTECNHFLSPGARLGHQTPARPDTGPRLSHSGHRLQRRTYGGSAGRHRPRCGG